MRYFEDDSHKIPDEIRNLSREELKKRVAECDEILRKERELRRQAKAQSA
jgi:hypothetical protein